MGEQIILASKSAARRAVLTGAGVPFEVAVAGVDEDAVKTAMLAQGATPRDVADALAEIKAVKISAGRPGFVIGSDQTLEFEGQLYDKAETLEAAAERLKTMRDFSDDFLVAYLALEGEEMLGSVGCYRLEGPGAQLFSKIEGDYFAILGLPLMGLLDLFRRHGVLRA